MNRFLKKLSQYDDSMTVKEVIEIEKQKETYMKKGFLAYGVFYEDSSPQQEELLSKPITEEEQGTLLGFFKQIYQDENNKNTK